MNAMEKKPTSQQISVLRLIYYGKNVRAKKEAEEIRSIKTEFPDFVIIVPQIGLCRRKPIFGALLSNECRRYIAALDAKK